MRAVCTGISGLNKKDYLADFAHYARRQHGKEIEVLDLGTFVEEEATRLFQQSHITISTKGVDRKVLDLPRSTLRELGATAWEQILSKVTPGDRNYVVSLHVSFRWKKALTLAVSTAYLDKFQPDLFMVLRDAPRRIQRALDCEPKWQGRLSEAEIRAWQDEEIEATRILAAYRQRDWDAFDITCDKEDVYKFLFAQKIRPAYSPERRSNPYRSVYCTAISGTNSREYLEAFCCWAGKEKGHEIQLLDLARSVVEEARKEKPSITRENILKEPKSELDKWRARALSSIRDEQSRSRDCIIVGHSCFRLNSQGEQLLLAFDPDEELVKWCQINPDTYVTFTDNIVANKLRLASEAKAEGLTLGLREISMWHDEERFFTRLIAENFERPHYIIPVRAPFETLYHIAFKRDRKKAYLSFPITEVRNKPGDEAKRIFEEKNDLKESLRERYVIFDPIDVLDGELYALLDSRTEFPYVLRDHLVLFKEQSGMIVMDFNDIAVTKERNGNYGVRGEPVDFSTSELQEVKDHIGDQIVERDYHLIDQSDWVVVYYPVPEVSAGVMSEVIYGFSHGRDVFAWWSPSVSPFLESYLTKGRACHDKRELLETLSTYST